jgi:hypothetical protein
VLIGRRDEASAAASFPALRAAVEVTALDLDVVVTKNGTFVNDLKKDEFVVVDEAVARLLHEGREASSSRARPLNTSRPDPGYLSLHRDAISPASSTVLR